MSGSQVNTVNARQLLILIAVAAAVSFNLLSQSNSPAAAPSTNKNDATIPVPRTGSMANRQSEVLQRAKDAPGEYDLEFIGDSITQGWGSAGKNVWKEFYGSRKAINFGVSGDHTQHVLWRFEHGQLDGIKARVAVVMIGTNNAKDNSESEILEGVAAVVRQIRLRQPDTKILLLAIFPREKSFSLLRGKILQVNQALARMEDGRNIFFLDIGPQFIEDDGSISAEMMKDAVHPGEKGYRIWANAMEPKLKLLLENK